MPFVARLEAWWAGLTFGTRRPARRVAALAVLGAVGGIAEAAVIILLVALASGGASHRLPLIDQLPTDTWALAGVALGALAVFATAQTLSAWLSARAGADALNAIRYAVVDAYLAASWPAQAAERTGALQELVTTNATLVALGTQQAANAAVGALNLGVVVVAAIAVSVWATLGLVGVAGLMLVVVRPFRRRSRRVAREAAGVSTTLATEVTESALVARELRVFGVADAARSRLGSHIEAVGRLFEALRFAQAADPPLIRAGTIAVVVLGVAAVASRGDVSLPLLGATVVLMFRALGHAQAISSVGHTLVERSVSFDRMQDRIREWRESSPTVPGTRPLARIGRLELESVSFTYPGGQRPALDQVDLDIVRGEQLAVVGRSGAGKSTLAAVVLGLVHPQAGCVRVDGVPLDEIDPADWRRRIALVPQEPRLLTGTVGENIRFLRDELDDSALEEAAHAAGLGWEVEGWHEGLDHHCGAGGAALSGGQRQRIALARALAGNPDLLVLDEPTSALDVHTEAALRDVVAALRGRTTVVIIAHRLSTLEACDRVVVVESGRIGAVGPAAQLAATDGYYREALSVSGLRP